MKNINKSFAVSAVVLLCVGCTTSNVEHDFGNSVRELRKAQTKDPSTLTNPSDAVVEGADPYAVNAAVEALRNDVPTRQEIQRDVVINVGNQGR